MTSSLEEPGLSPVSVLLVLSCIDLCGNRGEGLTPRTLRAALDSMLSQMTPVQLRFEMSDTFTKQSENIYYSELYIL